MGEDREAVKIDQKELAERLSDIDGLRAQIQSLAEEKKQQKESSEAQMAELKKEHAEELKKLQAQIARLETKIERLEAEKNALSGDLKKLSDEHRQLVATISKLVSAVPGEEMGKKMGEELYSFVLKDSKVPDVVIEGVGKFIDFKRYLGEAVERGAKEVCRRVEETLKAGPTEKE
jgi:predicted nuclease with TOPRIM domain